MGLGRLRRNSCRRCSERLEEVFDDNLDRADFAIDWGIHGVHGVRSVFSLSAHGQCDLPRVQSGRGRVAVVTGMMIPRLRPKSSQWPLKAPRRAFFLVLATLLPGGCSSGPPPAPGSTFVFSEGQATQTQSVLREAAQDSPRDPVVPLGLLPPDGIRWETMSAAVNFAVGVPELEMAVVDTVEVSDRERVFYLVDPHSWPARVTVRGLDNPPGVEVEAVMGPDPSKLDSQRRAADIRTRVLAAIEQYGRIRRLPAYTISSQPEQPLNR